MKFELKNVPVYLIYIAPTVHLAFGKRFGDLFNILSITCLIYLFRNGIEGKIINKKLFYFFSFLFFAYPLEIFMSQLFRWQWRIHDYMDQIRFIFAFPIFLYLINKRVDLSKFIEYAIPLALIVSYFSTNYLYIETQFGDRFTNNFTDPLAYGQICFSMSLLLLTTFFYSESTSNILNIYKVVGIIFGIIISIKTQSRTGWFSFPIVALALLYLNSQKLKIGKLALFILLIISITSGLYSFVDIVHVRIMQAITEIVNYPWNGGMSPDTSVGLRITFIRLGIYYISHNPWYGMGNKGFTDILFAPEVRAFADEFAIITCYEALFHNELITQTVRYGLLGIIGYFSLLIYPIFLFYKEYKRNYGTVRSTSAISIIFLLTQIIAGFSDEILNLKYMILYFMLIMAISYATIISESNIVNNNYFFKKEK